VLEPLETQQMPLCPVSRQEQYAAIEKIVRAPPGNGNSPEGPAVNRAFLVRYGASTKEPYRSLVRSGLPNQQPSVCPFRVC
jgi:hypothetical protein